MLFVLVADCLVLVVALQVRFEAGFTQLSGSLELKDVTVSDEPCK